MFDITILSKNKNNPRKIDSNALELLKNKINNLEKMLEARPIVYDEKHLILAGHQRFEILLSKGYNEVPDAWVKQVTGWTEEQKKKFIIFDNITDGSWEKEAILGEYWNEIELTQLGDDMLSKIRDNENIDIDQYFTDQETQIKEEWETISLEYTEDDYYLVTEKLLTLAKTKELAVLKLLNLL